MPNRIKLSIIIPTVQKCLRILDQLTSTLVRDEVVDEIIIINNLPDNKLEFSKDKIRIITPEKNLYVNASWNLGVKEAKNDNIALINDDILICNDFCSMVVNSSIFNNQKTGLIGGTNRTLKNIPSDGVYPIPQVDNKYNLDFRILENHLGTGDWGITIFGKRQNFYKIPEDIKIIYGDNYLLYQNKLNGYSNYYIANAPILHMHSPSSASSEFSHVIHSDIKEQAKYFK